MSNISCIRESRFHQHGFLDGELIVYVFSSLRYCVAVVGGNVSSGMLVAWTRTAHFFLYKICFQKNASDQQKPVENFIWDNYRHWAVIKSRGPRISELREIPSNLIPCLLVVYTRQLEILATALTNLKVYKCLYSILLQLTCWLFYTIVTDWKGSRIAHNL